MTLHTLRLRAPLRAPAEPVRTHEDRSLAYVLWLILFLVFAPIIGAHVAFVLFPGASDAQTVDGKRSHHGKHG